MKYYKFLEEKWADSFANGKSIRLGTLEHFRKEEKHAPGIGDRLEGATIGRIGDLHIDDTSNPAHQTVLRNLEQSGAIFIGQNIQITNGSFQLDVLDAWILCLTAAKASESPKFLLDKFNTIATSTNYNAVVEINNIDQFFKSLIYKSRTIHGTRLSDIIKDCFHRPVEYSELEFDMKRNSLQPHPFRKRPEFSNQSEYRIAMLPKKTPIEPITVSIPNFNGIAERIL